MTNGMSRRKFLGTVAGAASAGALASVIGMPAIAQTRTLRVSSYGGYFEDNFKAHIFPEFTKATGIQVESITQATSPDWLATMIQAAASGTAPSDVSMFSRDIMIKASRLGNVLHTLDINKIPNLARLDHDYIFGVDGTPTAVGALAWFASMVVNPEKVDIPTTWAEFWDTSKYPASLGFGKQFNSGMLDIIAATFFEGEATFATQDGIMALIEKASELKPNVALWWSTESQMEQAMKNGDVVGGIYFHDVAQLMAADGFPIRSVFPKEGNPQEFGSWCVSAATEKIEEAQVFIDFSCTPLAQALMSRKLGTAPVIDPTTTDLTLEEFEAVSGTPVIRYAYEAYLDNETFIKENWDKMLGS